jgi:hypothetical protein
MEPVAFDPVQALLLDGLVFVVASVIFAVVMWGAWRIAKRGKR